MPSILRSTAARRSGQAGQRPTQTQACLLQGSLQKVHLPREGTCAGWKLTLSAASPAVSATRGLLTWPKLSSVVPIVEASKLRPSLYPRPSCQLAEARLDPGSFPSPRKDPTGSLARTLLGSLSPVNHWRFLQGAGGPCPSHPLGRAMLLEQVLHSAPGEDLFCAKSTLPLFSSPPHNLPLSLAPSSSWTSFAPFDC